MGSGCIFDGRVCAGRAVKNTEVDFVEGNDGEEGMEGDVEGGGDSEGEAGIEEAEHEIAEDSAEYSGDGVVEGIAEGVAEGIEEGATEGVPEAGDSEAGIESEKLEDCLEGDINLLGGFVGAWSNLLGGFIGAMGTKGIVGAFRGVKRGKKAWGGVEGE